jgi:hypothetical protein
MQQAVTDEELDAWLVANCIATTQDVRRHLSRLTAELAARQVSTTVAMREIRYANAALRRLAPSARR